MMNARAIGVLGLVSLVLAGCGNHAGLDAAAATSKGQTERSVAIGRLVQNYEQARAARQWDLALSYADKLQKLAPDSALTAKVVATLADTNLHAEQARDHAHLAELWSYNSVVASGDDGNAGVLWTASIAAEGESDDADAAPHLVLREHPRWGRSVSLVLDHGKFDCAAKCTVMVQFDDQPARPFAASRASPNGSNLVIDDERSMRESFDKVRVVTVRASVDGRPRDLSFDVGGFDRIRLERRM